jgi:hypothetical protein
MVAASFLGGAFVNGPGSQLVQTWIARSLGLSDGAKISSVDLKAAVSTDTLPAESGPSKVMVDPGWTPLATQTTLAAADAPSKHDRSGDHHPSQVRQKVKQDKTASPESGSSTTSATLPKKPDPAGTTIPEGASVLVDPQVTPAIMNSLVALLPSSPAVSGSPSSSRSVVPSTPKLVSEGGGAWTMVERKMQTLGVSRFMIEAVPGGRVVFACLIPVAGRQAISQRFEAEGDDIVQAAHAALRRIGLWQAAQSVSK